MQLQTAAHAASFDVASLAMCRGLESQAASHLAAISSTGKKAAGETLFAEGDDADCVYEVVKGTLRVCKLLPDGRRQIMGFPGSGHLLGLAAGGNHAYTAEAVTDVTLCRYPRASVDRLVDKVPSLARRLWTATSDELRFAQQQLVLLGRKTATEKVASFLLLLAEQQKSLDGTVFVSMSRTDIGDYLGLTIETVSRTLSKLKRDGLIALPVPDQVKLLDVERLSELAEGESESEA